MKRYNRFETDKRDRPAPDLADRHSALASDMRSNFGKLGLTAAITGWLVGANLTGAQETTPASGPAPIIRPLPTLESQLRPLSATPVLRALPAAATSFLPLPNEPVGPASPIVPTPGSGTSSGLPAGKAQPRHIVNAYFGAPVPPGISNPNAEPVPSSASANHPATTLESLESTGLNAVPQEPGNEAPGHAAPGTAMVPLPALPPGIETENGSRFSLPAFGQHPVNEDLLLPAAAAARVSPQEPDEEPALPAGDLLEDPTTEPDEAEPAVPAPTPGEDPVQPFSPTPALANSGPWWRSAVAEPITGLAGSAQIDVQSLVAEGLRSAPQIQAISLTPLIRESDVCIARADFDPGLFARTLYEDRVDPVGNTLTTGGLPFLEDNIWSGQAGFRQKFFTGGNLEVSQKLGFQNSNSRFFVPQDQGTATLAVNLEQPLMRGRGQAYNRSQIFLADIAVHAARDELAAKLQEELTSIVTGYWNLYSSRAQLLQRRKNLELGQEVLQHLEGRAQFDTLPLQLAQARAAVASRETALANAERDVRIAESEIRRRIGDAQWLAAGNVELLTAEPPLDDPELVELGDVVVTALHNRPELRQATQRTKTTAVRNQIAANELLPDLRLLLSSYVAALEGETGIERAWTGQFSATPGYAAGFQYDFPWRNRAARGRFKQAELEYSKAQFELEQVTVNLIADAQQSWYRLESARTRLHASLIALDAAAAELERNNLRWDTAAMVEGDWSDGQTQSLILDQLLASQQKLFEAERIVVESELELKLSQINLKRATGTLLGVGDVPAVSADSAPAAPPPDEPVPEAAPEAQGPSTGY